MLDRGREDLSTSQRMIMTQESQPLSLSSAIQITPCNILEIDINKLNHDNNNNNDNNNNYYLRINFISR